MAFEVRSVSSVVRRAGVVVQRRPRDVELGQHQVREVERPVRHDVHLDPVQPGIPPNRIRASLISCAGVGRPAASASDARAAAVIRDGDVVVPSPCAAWTMRRTGVAPVTPRRVHVQIAANLDARDGRGQVAARAASTSSPCSRNSTGMDGSSRAPLERRFVRAVRPGCPSRDRRPSADAWHSRSHGRQGGSCNRDPCAR